MLRKAQAEFALILGLLVIAAIVGVYSYSSLTPPPVETTVLTEEQQGVASYVNELIREAALETIADLYESGGYLDVSEAGLSYATHKGFGDVAFWQVCGNYEIPDLEANFNEGVDAYIDANLPASQSIGGRTAVFGKDLLQVSSRLYDGKVTVSVRLPTTFEGLSLPQPYVIDVSTKMGRIYDFARNFARMQAECRVLDLNLLDSLRQSTEYSRPCWIPFTSGNADASHILTWDNLRDCMEMHIKYSLSNTVLGEDLWTNSDGAIVDLSFQGHDGHASEFFFVPTILDYTTNNVPESVRACSGSPLAGNLISSKKYEDLNVMFMFGDDDHLDTAEFSAPPVLEIRPRDDPALNQLGGLQIAEYAQVYSVKYPVIVTVWDESVERSFNFATFVYMQNNAVGELCTATSAIAPVVQGAASAELAERCYDGAREYARITVIDGGTYKPVTGAEVRYDICELGGTDDRGEVEGHVPEVPLGTLSVTYNNFEYAECYNYRNLKDVVIVIPENKRFRFHFNIAQIEKNGLENTYRLVSVSPATGLDIVNVFMQRDANACDMHGLEFITNFDFETAAFGDELYSPRIAVDEYNVSVLLRSEDYSGEWNVMGFLNATKFTPSGTDLYVYAPSMAGFDEAADTENLRQYYEECGLPLVSDKAYAGGGCPLWTAPE